MRQTTGGSRFDPREGPIYFIAANPRLARIGGRIHPHVLVPADQLSGQGAQKELASVLQSKVAVMLDSGVHSVLQAQMKKDKLTTVEAFSLKPAEVEGYEKVKATFIDLALRLGEQMWGYVELDFGGAEQKCIIRHELETRWNLRPIPVYHPLVDPPEYLDELCTKYDRICVGNLAHQAEAVRLRIAATIWHRMRAYPGVWVHGLGAAPDQRANAFGYQSVDASSWLVQVQYPIGFTERAMGQPVHRLDHEYRPERGTTDPEKSSVKGAELGAYICAMIQRSWRSTSTRYAELAPPGPLMGASA